MSISRRLFVLSSACIVAYSQPRFDAVSLKPAGEFIPGAMFARGGPGTSDPGRFTQGRVALMGLLTRAYGVENDQVQGPEWIGGGDTNAYSISATMPPDTTKEQFRLMLQAALAERFGLRIHHETRDFPGYDLITAAGGPHLQATAQLDTTETPATALGTVPGFGPDRFPVLPPGSAESAVVGRGTERVKFQARSMAELAHSLGNLLHNATGAAPGDVRARVTDRTGLSGRYDFTLEFDCQWCMGIAGLPESVRATLGMPVASNAGAANETGSGLPSLFSVLEKQLGLKLVKSKNVPVDVIVIDRVEKIPLAN